MERHLVALDVHDPTMLPLARGAKFTMTEAFSIRGGKITHIVAQMAMLPYRQPTGRERRWAIKGAAERPNVAGISEELPELPTATASTSTSRSQDA